MVHTEEQAPKHSRNSSETHTLDLEMGDARLHKEEDIVDEKVGISKFPQSDTIDYWLVMWAMQQPESSTSSHLHVQIATRW